MTKFTSFSEGAGGDGKSRFTQKVVKRKRNKSKRNVKLIDKIQKNQSPRYDISQFVQNY